MAQRDTQHPDTVALLTVVVDIDPVDEDEFNRWYDEEHLPEKRATPGFRSARRFKDHAHPGRYLAIYEINDPDLVTSPAYMNQTMTEWSQRMSAAFRTMERNVWVEITKPAPATS